MYTGIIECTGTLSDIKRSEKGATIYVKTPLTFDVTKRVSVGDSVATNGVCVTATKILQDGFLADVSLETIKLTCYQYYKKGSVLNLELPCTPSTHLGGHIVQGHVDGVGKIESITPLGEALNIWISYPEELAPFIAYKGSIAVDGASLTVNDVKDNEFRLTIIPHTQEVLNMASWQEGDYVNIEVDVLARYLQRLFTKGALGQAKSSKQSKLSLDTLMKNGFV